MSEPRADPPTGLAHTVHCNPERFFFSPTDSNSCVMVVFADDAPQRAHGRLATSQAPRLGVRLVMKTVRQARLQHLIPASL